MAPKELFSHGAMMKELPEDLARRKLCSRNSNSTPTTTTITSSEKRKDLLLKGKSLKDRSRIPPSTFLILALVIGIEYSAGLWTKDTFHSLVTSIQVAGQAIYAYFEYLCHLLASLVAHRGEGTSIANVLTAVMVTLFASFTAYILLYIPFRAGMWTGVRALRHKAHRYMGLLYLILYASAWIEFITHYERGGKDSLLIHYVSILGVCQGVSAYFSFKVLPELADPGYYSDKAVLSRTFVHENQFFTLWAMTGSCLYNDTIRTAMMTHPIGRLILLVHVYAPYVLVRPFFPMTSFTNAGTSMAGRSVHNATFYRIGTLLVKVFYLWAKYFLGFFINWVIYLGLATDTNMVMIRGMFLMNCGTVSISVFLHTLRFKKALSPVWAFSIYLVQIYGTFLALPYGYDLFLSHKRLMALALLGLMINMTRKRWLHAMWCLGCAYLHMCTDIEW